MDVQEVEPSTRSLSSPEKQTGLQNQWKTSKWKGLEQSADSNDTTNITGQHMDIQKQRHAWTHKPGRKHDRQDNHQSQGHKFNGDALQEPSPIDCRI